MKLFKAQAMGIEDDTMRTAQLGSDHLHLLGQVPRRGERLTAEFTIPAARLADKPLATGDSMINQDDLRAARPDAQVAPYR